MNKLLFLSGGLALALSLPAQMVQYNANGSVYRECLSVRTTKPLSELSAEADAQRKNNQAAHPHPSVDGDAHYAHFLNKNKSAHNTSLNIPDGSLQTENGTVGAPAPIVNIDGLQSVQGGYPLDANGMIGSNYYVQTVNSYYAIYSKTGTLVASHDLYYLFGSIGDGDCGDPVTMYDKMADRWIITEFEGCTNRTQDIDTLLIAVSKTNDPTGAYYLYAFNPGTNNYDDYPKYAVWADGYYMTCNCQSPDMVVVYDRTKMLTGNTAGMISITWNDNPWNFVCNTCNGPDFFCPMMLDCDGALPPYGSPEYLFYYWDPNWASGGNNEICIDKISVNWTSKTGSTSHYDTLPTTAFNSTFTGNYAADIPQPGNSTSNYLDALDGFFSYRIPYLRWGTYNAAVMCNAVNIGTSSVPVSAIRWYELHQDTTSKKWSIYQQATYGPNDGVSRWNASIAMDQNHSIGLEYNVSSPGTVYPGCRYTGRRSCDALNTMTVSEVDVRNGNAISNTPEQGGNRWGDYSHLSVDPIDGITFWATNMYTNSGYSFGENIGTRIYSFQITKCPSDAPNETNSYSASLKAYQSGGTLNVKGTGFPENEKLSVQLFDINGRTIMQTKTVTNSNNLESSFNVSSLAKGIYIVRAGNDNIQRVVKVAIQ